MITYTAQFVKSNGTLRKIKFARLADVPHLLPPSKGGAHKSLAAHQEMVWDLEENNYRIFNWGSAIGDVIAKRDF
jgi:hypothetical protein